MHKRIEQTTLPRVPQMRGSRNRGAPSDAKLVGGEKLATADEESKLTIGNVNVGSMSGREGEVIDMIKRRGIDICCLQETRWTGIGEKEIGGYKFIYMGGTKGVSGVGVVVSPEWESNIVNMTRVSARIMMIQFTVGKSVLKVIACYAPQQGLKMPEKVEFYDSLDSVISGVGDEEMVILCGDFNCHVGEHADGFEGVHGGKGFGKRNEEGEMLLEFACSRDMIIANTWFDKEDSKKVSYESGGCKTVVDYILIRKIDRAKITDVKIIGSEPCILQHKLMVCKLHVKKQSRKRRVEFTSKCRVWKLKDSGMQADFNKFVKEKERARNRGEGSADSIWGELKKCLLEGATQVCGKTKGPPRHNESWWWNDEVDEAVTKKRRLYMEMEKVKREEGSKSGSENETMKVKESKQAYREANRESKKVIGKAKERERRKLGETLEQEESKGRLFKIVKQMVKKNAVVCGGGCLKDGNGKVVVDEEKIQETWRCHFEKLSNEEFSWDRGSLGAEKVVSGPIGEITCQEVRVALEDMKSGKASGPSGVVTEMLKAAGEIVIEWMTDLFNAVVREGKVPADWCKSWMISIYKGKGDAMECGSYRGIKLLEHAMKVFERVIEARVRDRVKIDNMQFGFSPGKGTTDAIFIVRQLQEKYLAKKKDLWMAFIDLEKAFDRVPREVLWWALREVEVEEWLIKVIQSLYEGATTSVKLRSGESQPFEVKVGVHQGSVLSPLLFIIVLEALSRRFREGLPYELLYADDLVLMADSMEELTVKLEKWKESLETKGLRVNLSKTKVMRCSDRDRQPLASGKYPCGICKKGVMSNSIECTGCKKWIHKKCSGIKGALKEGSNYRCTVCKGQTGSTEGVKGPELLLGGEGGGGLEYVTKFCYLGDMIGAGGGAGDASRTRVRCAWGKFNELKPVLAERGTSLKLKGKIYKACVQSVLVYGSETWPLKEEDARRLERNEMWMVRRMCGVKLSDRKRSEYLRSRLGIECVVEVVRRGRLRWFGHVERMVGGEWVSACRNVKVEGKGCKGRPRKTWLECVKDDMKELNLKPKMAQNRARWREYIHGTRPTPVVREKRTLRR